MRDDGENKSDEYSKRELDMLERQRYLEGVIVQLTAELTEIGGLLNYVARLKDALRQTKQYIDDDCLTTAREWIDASLTDEARSE